MKRTLLVFILALVSLSAKAEVDPVEQLKQAFSQAQQKSNQFAGYSMSCIGIVLFTKSGPKSSNRTCVGSMLPKSFIEQFAADKGLQFVHRNQYMDLINAGPMTKGNAYYLVNYDDNGNANEITVINDALP